MKSPERVRRNQALFIAASLTFLLAFAVTRGAIKPGMQPVRSGDAPIAKLSGAKSSTPVSAQTQARIKDAVRKLPLRFEPNLGQSDSQVKFLSRGSGYTLFLTHDEAVLSLQKSSAGAP